MRIADLPFAQKAFRRIQRHGLAGLLHFLLIRALNALLPFKILRGVTVAAAAPDFLAQPPQYHAAFLSAEELKRFSTDSATELTPRFIEEALRNGDACYAICDGEVLAAYGWYSTRPTPIDPSQLELHFAPGYVYMYKGFTDPRYRGQRLHAIGMTRALQHYLDTGARGIVSYIESTNFDSLKSCLRMGYEVFGSIYVVRLFGRYFTFATPGCRPFGFRLADEDDHRRGFLQLQKNAGVKIE